MVLRSRFQAVQKQTKHYNQQRRLTRIGWLVHDLIMDGSILLDEHTSYKKGPISLIEVSKVFWAYFNWDGLSPPQLMYKR